MHSSRMRTVRCSDRLGGLPGGGVCLGCVCLGGFLPSGVSSQGGVSTWGCLPRRVYSSPPRDRITDRCKNITFRQLRLRTVIRQNQWYMNYV